jgi:hypothetical protein
MSAELLRRAAAKIRTDVAAASPGKWEPFVEHGRDYTDQGWSWIGVKNPDHEVAATYPIGSEHERHEADAALIAAMGPPVALAVADWLDAYAGQCGFLRVEPNPYALTVARAYLGESA